MLSREKGKEEEMTPEQVKLLQTRDLNYVVHKRTAEKNKIERLKSGLHLLDSSASNKHTFFVDSDREKREFDLAKRLGTHPGLVGRTYNRPRLDDLGRARLEGLEEAAGQSKTAYKELGQRIERERKLAVMQGKMEARKHLQNKKLKPSKVVKPETKDSAPILRWPTERKR